MPSRRFVVGVTYRRSLMVEVASLLVCLRFRSSRVGSACSRIRPVVQHCAENHPVYIIGMEVENATAAAQWFFSAI